MRVYGTSKLCNILFTRELASSPGVRRSCMPAALTGEYVQDEKLVSPSAQAQDDSLAQGLWERSAQLAGLPADALT